MLRAILFITGLWLCLALAAPSVLAEPDSADSTEAREPSPPKKSAGDILLDVPGFILSVPVYIVQGLTAGGVYVVEHSSGIRSFAESLFDPRRSLAPVISFGGEEALVGGVRYQRYDVFSPTDRFRVKATYSTTNYSLFNIKYQDLRSHGGQLAYTIQGGYARAPRRELYGLGNNSSPDLEGAYTDERLEFRADLGLRLNRKVMVGAFGGYSKVNISDGHHPEAVNNLGALRNTFNLPVSATRNSQFVTLGGTLDLDFRNMIGQPSAGGRYQFEFGFNSGVGENDDIEFTRTRVNLQQFFELWDRRIIAVRGIVQDIDRSEDVSPNPIYLLSALGGSNSLRGYEPHRFTDRDLALFTIEYRYPIWDVIDAFLFLDEGRVFQKISEDFTWRDWKYSAGVGLRVWTPNAVVASVEIAKSDEGYRFYLQFADDF